MVSTRNDGAVPLCEVKSACTTPGHSAADRTELFWSGVRSAGTGQMAMSWLSRDSLARHRSSGIVHTRAPRLGTQAEALDKIVDRRRRGARDQCRRRRLAGRGYGR